MLQPKPEVIVLKKKTLTEEEDGGPPPWSPGKRTTAPVEDLATTTLLQLVCFEQLCWAGIHLSAFSFSLMLGRQYGLLITHVVLAMHGDTAHRPMAN